MESTKKRGILPELKVVKTEAKVSPVIIQSHLAAFIKLRSVWHPVAFNIKTEHYALFLTDSHELIGWTHINTGKEIDFKQVCAYAAASMAERVIVAKNHVNAKETMYATPKIQEEATRLSNALSLFDVTLLDYLIISPKGTYHSLNREILGVPY